jgi:hypothetical protein
MNLKEEAKTLVQIIRENCAELYNLRCRYCIGQCEFEDSDSFAGKWVRLEDAEQAIDKFKQKLQRLINELKLRPSELGTLCSTYQEGWLDAMVLAILKFEELLQEAKP